MTRASDDQWLYSWAVNGEAEDAGENPCGVSGVKQRARGEVFRALLGAGGVPGVVGVVTACRLAQMPASTYIYGEVVAEAELDSATGTVVWRTPGVGDHAR